MLRDKIERKKQIKKRIKKKKKRMSVIFDIKTKQNQMKMDKILKNNLKRNPKQIKINQKKERRT
jgi:diphthamide synthase subunit DPH2